MKKGNKVLFIVTIVIILFLSLIIYNIYYNNGFFYISIDGIFTIFISVVLAFWFVQKKEDQRQKRDNLVRIIEKIQSIVNSNDLYDFGTTKVLLINQRAVRNKIKTINTYYKEEFDIIHDIAYIESEFEAIKDIIALNISNKDNKSINLASSEIKKCLMNIDNRFDNILCKLYI